MGPVIHALYVLAVYTNRFFWCYVIETSYFDSLDFMRLTLLA